jgi:hypothetical protein
MPIDAVLVARARVDKVVGESSYGRKFVTDLRIKIGVVAAAIDGTVTDADIWRDCSNYNRRREYRPLRTPSNRQFQPRKGRLNLTTALESAELLAHAAPDNRDLANLAVEPQQVVFG